MNSQAPTKDGNPKMHGSMKMPSKGHKEVTGMHFKPMENGMVSETHHRTFRGGQGGGPSWDHGSTDMIHPNMNHAVKHLKASMGHVFGNPMPEKETDSMPEQGEKPADMKDSDVE